MLGQLTLIAALILFNAFFAASEIAILSVRRVRVRQLADERLPAALALLRLTGNPGVFLATIQVGVTLTGFFAAAVGAVSAVILLEELLREVPLAAVSNASHAIALVVETTLIALITLLLGELVPKNLAIQNAEGIALAVARPLEAFSVLARPLVALLTITTDLILHTLGIQRQARPTTVTEDELRSMIDMGGKEGVLAPLERDIIEGAFDLGEIRVGDVMVPRPDVVALERSSTPAQALDLFLRYRYSRLPVYQDTMDNIIGVIVAKDLLQMCDPANPLADIGEVIRPVPVISENRRVSEVLGTLQRGRVHIAVVLDEFGGTAGIITLEDVLEELVGEIAGAATPQGQDIELRGPEEIVVSGRVSLAEVNDLLSLNLSDEEAHSVGGFIQDHLGRLAVPGDEVVAPDARLKVLSMAGRRIKQVQIVKVHSSEENNGD
ncbi:MAG: hemolysin family protein [Bacteroidetes bacterium]|nr:hemolysin family protein [Bacteroidota bacterium]MCL5027264.1 hemolysin family protein [Chloroflexota bacterium]